jgi:hypothetical protein
MNIAGRQRVILQSGAWTANVLVAEWKALDKAL